MSHHEFERLHISTIWLTAERTRLLGKHPLFQKILHAVGLTRASGKRLVLPLLGGALAIFATIGNAQAYVCDPVGCGAKGGFLSYKNNFEKNNVVNDFVTLNVLSPVGQNQRAELEIEQFVNPSSGAVSFIKNFAAVVSSNYQFSPLATFANGVWSYSLVNRAILDLTVSEGNTLAIHVTGTATGAQGGSYSGYLFVTPVPAAVFLFAPALAGVGALGARRRRPAGETLPAAA